MEHYAKKATNKDVEEVQEKRSYQSNGSPKNNNKYYLQHTESIEEKEGYAQWLKQLRSNIALEHGFHIEGLVY